VEGWDEKDAAHELIFSTVSGKPIAPNNVLRRWVWPACQAADLGTARSSSPDPFLKHAIQFLEEGYGRASR
jgi:hypothetical protein